MRRVRRVEYIECGESEESRVLGNLSINQSIYPSIYLSMNQAGKKAGKKAGKQAER